MAAARYEPARILSVAALLIGVACTARAAENELRTHVSARMGYSDNISLAPKGFEIGERLSEVTAGVDFGRTEQRHDTRISYEAQGIFYDESRNSNEVFSTLDAQSQLALVLDRLFLDLMAVYDQTVVDAQSKYSFNKLALTGNRTDVAILGVTPSLSLAFGANIDGDLFYYNSVVDYADDVLEDYKEHVVSFTLGNSGTRQGASWEIRYDREKYDYETSPLIEFETFETQLGSWLNPTVQLYAIVGLESDYASVGNPTLGTVSSGLEEEFWYVGGEWRPNDRTELVVETGDRSYGEAHRFSWSYFGSGGGIRMGYFKEPSTFLREQLQSVRAVGELSPIDSLDGPQGNLFYLQERADITFLLDRPRSSAALRVFNERRFDIVDATNDIEEQTEEYKGGEVSLRWQMNPVASVGVSLQSALRRSTLNVVDDELTYFSVSYDKRIGRQTLFTLDAGHERSEPKSASGGTEYEENQVIVGIQRSFGSAETARAPQRFSGYLNARR